VRIRNERMFGHIRVIGMVPKGTAMAFWDFLLFSRISVCHQACPNTVTKPFFPKIIAATIAVLRCGKTTLRNLRPPTKLP